MNDVCVCQKLPNIETEEILHLFPMNDKLVY